MGTATTALARGGLGCLAPSPLWVCRRVALTTFVLATAPFLVGRAAAFSTDPARPVSPHTRSVVSTTYKQGFVPMFPAMGDRSPSLSGVFSRGMMSGASCSPRTSAASPGTLPRARPFSSRPDAPSLLTPRPGCVPPGVVRALISVGDGLPPQKETRRTQACDYTTLCALAAEVQMELPLRVEDVVQVGDNSIGLKLVGGDDEGVRWLLASWHKRFSRVCLMHGEPPLLDDRSAFSTRVEGVLKGLHAVEIRVEPFSRIVCLTLKNDKEWSPPLGEADGDGGRDHSNVSLQRQGGEVQDDAAGMLSADEAYSVESVGPSSEENEEDDELAKDSEARVKSFGAELWLDASQAGMPRVFALNDDRKAVTAAPAEDRNGNLWKGIGRRYYPPQVDLACPSLEQPMEEWLAWIKEDLSARHRDRDESFKEGSPSSEGESGPQSHGTPLLRTVLLRRFAGLSPALIHQMLSGAGIPFDEPVDTLSLDDMKRLHKIWRGWLWTLRDGIFVSAYDQERDPTRFRVVDWPSPKDEEDSFDTEDQDTATAEGQFQFNSVSHMVSCYYQMAELEELRDSMRLRIHKAIAGQRAKIKDFQKRLEEAASAEELKRQGDLLSANQHLISMGQSVVFVPDWGAFQEGDDEPPTVEISIDPSISATENVQKIFKRYKKLNRQAEHVEPLLQQARSSLTELVQVIEVLDTMPDLEPGYSSSAFDVLSQMRARLEDRGLLRANRVNVEKTQARADALVEQKMRPKRKATKLRNARGKAPEFMRFTSPSGFEVVAGRSSKQNDRVTWGLAKDRDLWFHARGIGGSHVILIAPKGIDEDSISSTHPEDVLFAAGIAAFYSKGKKDTKVDVSFTPRKHLRPPPARVRRPGMVMITKEQVVTVKPLDGDELREIA